MRKFIVLFRNLFYVFLLIVLTVSIFYQIKVEVYKNELIREYNFYSDSKRLSWQPFALFYIESKKWKKNDNRKYWQCLYKSYKDKGIMNEEELLFNIEFNAYLTKCYYRKDELDIEKDSGKILSIDGGLSNE